MDERTALTTLLQVSDLFTDEQKVKMQERTNELSDTEVRQIGVFLASYLQQESLDLQDAQGRITALLGLAE